MIRLWDDAEFDHDDPDELAPTLRLVPTVKLTFNERLEADARSLNARMNYEEAA